MIEENAQEIANHTELSTYDLLKPLILLLPNDPFMVITVMIFSDTVLTDGSFLKFLDKNNLSVSAEDLGGVIAAVEHKNKEGFALATTYEVHSGLYLVHMGKFDDNAFDYGTIAHEMMHVVFGRFRQIGLPHTYESEEAYCYTVGYMVREFLNAIWALLKYPDEYKKYAFNRACVTNMKRLPGHPTPVKGKLFRRL